MANQSGTGVSETRTLNKHFFFLRCLWYFVTVTESQLTQLVYEPLGNGKNFDLALTCQEHNQRKLPIFTLGHSLNEQFYTVYFI